MRSIKEEELVELTAVVIVEVEVEEVVEAEADLLMMVEGKEVAMLLMES